MFSKMAWTGFNTNISSSIKKIKKKFNSEALAYY